MEREGEWGELHSKRLKLASSRAEEIVRKPNMEVVWFINKVEGSTFLKQKTVNGKEFGNLRSIEVQPPALASEAQQATYS